MSIRIVSLIALWSMSVVRVLAAAPTVSDDRPATPSAPLEGYRLAWADEFNGETLDLSKWRHRGLGPRKGGVNVKETVRLDGDGRLILTTRKEGDVYQTAMIATHETYLTTYGYFECRVQLQQEVGHWSAFWLQSPTYGQPVGDPARAGTEIDIFEYLRRKGDAVQHTLHWDGYGEDHQSKGKVPVVPGLGKGWHTFGLLWTEDEYVFYVDGRVTWRTRDGVSRRSEYMILSLEVGEWAGDIGEAALPDHLLVDYVRVFKKAAP